MIDVDHCTDLDKLRHEVKCLRHQIGKLDKRLVAQRTDLGRVSQQLEAITSESIARRRHIEYLLSELRLAYQGLDAAGQDRAALRALRASQASAPGDNHPRDRDGIRQGAST